MYAVTGVTDKVGGELARTLVAAGRPGPAVVRDAKQGQEWAASGLGERPKQANEP
jgi:NAD(P)H dehydrogenase (quinone)